MKNDNEEFGATQEEREGTAGSSNGKSMFIPGRNAYSRSAKLYEMGHELGNSHLYGRAMSEYGGNLDIGPRHFGEMLSRVGVGNAETKPVLANGSIKEIIGTAPANFNSGHVVKAPKKN